MIRSIALAVLWLALAALPARGNLGLFGQNKVQYNSFRWQILRGENVLLYHYREEEELARYALAIAEECHADLCRRFRLKPGGPVRLVLYNSHHHFQETNLVPYFLPEGVAGFTEFLKGRVALPFTGSYAELRQVLNHELVHVFQREKLRETYRLHPGSRFGPPPLWLTEGLAEHWSGAGGSVHEMVLRDLTVNQELPSVRELHRMGPTFELYRLGQSLVSFISSRYGEERLLLLYEFIWRGETFGQVLETVLGDDEDVLTEAWHRSLRELYYPLVAEYQDVPSEAECLTGDELMARMPTVAVVGGEEEGLELLYLSSRRLGYTSVYARTLRGEPGGEREILRGDREERFESFHPGRSRMDASRQGRLALVSKFQDRDALYLVDLAGGEPEGPFHFAPLISISSPSWSPDGRRLVFAALSWDGYTDLYLFTPATGALERITRDRFFDSDPDWSATEGLIVFSSDRGPHGGEGYENLWLFDLSTYLEKPLTSGRWNDRSPRWSPDGQSVLFSSDREGVPDLWLCAPGQGARKLTHTLTGAIEADWYPDGTGVVFTAFRRSRFAIYHRELAAGGCRFFESEIGPAPNELSPAEEEKPDLVSPPGWEWPSLPDPPAEVEPYRPTYSLDVAQGAVVYDMGGTLGEGVQAALSDALRDRILLLSFSHSSESLGEFLPRLSLGINYVNLAHRLNYAVGAFHYVGDFLDRRGIPFFERRAGVSFVSSYPFSRFHRWEAGLLLAHADRSDFPAATRRRGMIAASFLALVRDTSIWQVTGPMDGARARAALGATMDLRRTTPISVSFLVDGRRYFRLGPRTAWAIRLLAGFSEGEKPDLFVLGGSWNLRGYRRNSLLGNRSLLLSQELRFRLVEPFRVLFPLGGIRFPATQGALFFDAGDAWDAGERDPSLVGSAGVGARVGLGGLTVVRLDLAWPTDFRAWESDPVVDFFFGWNF